MWQKEKGFIIKGGMNNQQPTTQKKSECFVAKKF